MPKSPQGSVYLYGLHDPGGERIMLEAGAPGWVLVTVEVGYDPGNTSGQNFTTLTSAGLGVIVRLNAGYAGVGTLPFEKYYDNFAKRCANFVANSRGANFWIVGNEPNHPIEWPGADWDWNQAPPRPRRPDSEGEKITPARYAACYKKVRAAIHNVAGHENDLVLVAAVAPWNNLTTYSGNTNGDWVRYFSDMLAQIGPANCDGITLHTYTHGTDPALVTSAEKMQAAGFQKYHYHFRAYRDFMEVIPADMQGLPVYITETDQGDVPWRDENTGWVRAAYREINDWNKGHRQKIRSLILYRWPRVGDDRWWIEGKHSVIEDFKQALALRYKSELDLADRVAAAEALYRELQPRIQAATALAPQAADLIQAVDRLKADVEKGLGLAAEVTDIERQVREIATGIPSDGDGFEQQIADISSTLPQHPTLKYPQRSLADFKRVIVHHTGLNKPEVTPQRIAQAQVDQGKAGITYHFLVYPDGKLYQTQPFTVATGQTGLATANADAIGVALHGNFSDNPPPAVQLDRAAELIVWLLRKFNLTPEVIVGRIELEPKIFSPGRQWLQGAQYKLTLVAEVKALLENFGTCEAKLARARQRMRELETQVAQLQPQAARVPGLEGRVTELEAKVKNLEEKLRGCSRGVSRPAIVDKIQALPKHPTDQYGPREDPITHILIHHTETPKIFLLENLALYFINHWKWPGMAYHYVIAADGTIYQCQPDHIHTYHAGDANSYSLAISLIGSFMPTYHGKPQPAEDQLPTPVQLRSVAHLAAWLMQEYNVPLENVKGHKEVGNTQCPGDFWTAGPAWKNDLHAQIQAIRTNQNPVGQPLEHYLLFWDHGQEWAAADWENAQGYIAHFRPTTGFATADARLARHVTIVGGDAGVSGTDEAQLIAAGSVVYRLAGQNEAETKALLEKLIAADTPWPGAAAVGPRAIPAAVGVRAAEAAPVLDWNVPLDRLPTEGLSPADFPIERRVRIKLVGW
jgi:N-acetyl-anhydromuramyl-L-alanine amidase AmpD